MIFLKRLETVGFKSFADNTVIEFDSPLIGIVGPNGSGKSNINDAVRWAFGEQSNKSLRSDNSSDIVFAGSQNHVPLNYAEVTLVFDNSTKIFSALEYEEVSIKRVYKKIENESSYFINNQRVRLKDVLEVALETGLTKSSLAMISQGSVSNFVESKPEERRGFFEEAAGVSKYKKRKEEAIRNLVKAQDNYDRLNDIVNEKEKRLPTLKKQAEKAIAYKENFNKLKDLEIIKAVQQIQLFENNISGYKKSIDISDIKIDKLNKSISDSDFTISKLEESVNAHDKKIQELNSKINFIVKTEADYRVKINTLEVRRQNNIDPENSEKIKINVINEYKENISSKKALIVAIDKLKIKLNKYEKSLEKLTKLKNNLDNQNNFIDKAITKLNTEISISEENFNQKNYLHPGVKAVIENKNNLSGIVGLVNEVISIPSAYKTAIDILLRGSYQNIVVNKSDDVKTAINFLKNNKAGTATFLPLDNLKANAISGETRFIIQKSEGFVGFANELVEVEKKYEIVANNLLCNGIVVDTFDNAIKLAKSINRYNIVTLSGEHVRPYGAITGGLSIKNNQNNLDNISNIKNKKLERDKNLADMQKIAQKNQELSFKISEADSIIKSFSKQLAENNTMLKTIELQIDNNKNSFLSISGVSIEDYLNNNKILSENDEMASISADLKKISYQKLNFQEEVNTLISLRESDNSRLSKERVNNKQLSEQRQVETSTRDKISFLLKQNYASLNTESNLLSRSYEMTIDSAKTYVEGLNIDDVFDEELLSKMRNEMKKIGSVDFESIEIYETENSEYEAIVNELYDVSQSISNIKKAIEELDVEMIEQFSQTIKDINKVLPEVFEKFFNGGKASIAYTDPENVIDSGIEILITPSGKKITNLNLLSGGEKSLVALATLFAILKVRPIPLVMLDEVEAPLDIVNVEKFAKFLKTYNNQTQFIVVTHRQGTMENCDVLFGATMQEPGITKIVKINLVEARKHSSEE